MKVILFGAGGFIGTYLVDRLVNEGVEVLAVDINLLSEEYYKQQNIPFAHCDISIPEQLKQLPTKHINAVINLACVQPANVSQANYSPVEYFRVNAIGVLNILEFCRKAGIHKVIHTVSHQNMRGSWSQGKAITENEPRSIKYLGEYAIYSISESTAMDCVMHYAEQYRMRSIIFRLPPVYGYGPHTEIFKDGKPIKTGFQVFIDNATVGKPLEVWGNAHNGRDIIYVKDVVSAYVLALQSQKASGLYNIASGKYLTLQEQAETIIKVFSSKSHIIYRPDIPNNLEPFLYDISKAKHELGWSPQFSFEDMLVDYQKELTSKRFDFLVEKRRQLLKATS